MNKAKYLARTASWPEKACRDGLIRWQVQGSTGNVIACSVWMEDNEHSHEWVNKMIAVVRNEQVEEWEWMDYQAGKNTEYPEFLTRERFIKLRNMKLEYFNKHGAN